MAGSQRKKIPIDIPHETAVNNNLFKLDSITRSNESNKDFNCTLIAEWIMNVIVDRALTKSDVSKWSRSCSFFSKSNNPKKALT